MRFKLLVLCLLGLGLNQNVFGAVVVEKRSRQLPFVEVFGCEGVHAFVFRGPKGTSRRPILVPPEEYWTAREAGLYSFVLRYHSGNVCSRLVTSEVFARYHVGDDFRDSTIVTETTTRDSKTMQWVDRRRRHTAQIPKRSHAHSLAKHHSTKKRHVAKHQRSHRAKRLAAR